MTQGTGGQLREIGERTNTQRMLNALVLFAVVLTYRTLYDAVVEAKMTTAQVEALLGHPDAVDRIECGTETNAPWPCTQWKFISTESGRARIFVVFFSKSGDAWRVALWKNYGW